MYSCRSLVAAWRSFLGEIPCGALQQREIAHRIGLEDVTLIAPDLRPHAVFILQLVVIVIDKHVVLAVRVPPDIVHPIVPDADALIFAVMLALMGY
jgi:hypothetical protein